MDYFKPSTKMVIRILPSDLIIHKSIWFTSSKRRRPYDNSYKCPIRTLRNGLRVEKIEKILELI